MPYDRSLYPPDWRERSRRIRARDGNHCAFCGVPNGARIIRDPADPAKYRLAEVDALGNAIGRSVRVTLTVAHLIDGGPLDCPDEDLAALCNRCHLLLDGPLHARNAAATRRRHRVEGGQMELATDSSGQ